MGKSKLIWGGIVIIALIFAGFLWYQSYGKKGNNLLNSPQTENGAGTADSLENVIPGGSEAVDEIIPEDDTDYNAICESGEWLKIADQSGEMSSATGKLRKVYPDDASSQFKSYQYYIEGTESFGLAGTAKDLFKLDYFEDRQVEAQGLKNSGKYEIAVAQVKCAGAETDKNLIESRKKLTNYLAANINSIAPSKAKYQKWVVLTIDFVDEGNVYVEYYDSIDDDENSDIEEDTTRKVLLETSLKSGGGYDTKVLAYWDMGEDDFVLKTGTDKFENVDDFVISYEYDPEAKTWERID